MIPIAMPTATAVFGGGCFWCVEAVFKMLRGVASVQSGYASSRSSAGGTPPTYEQVSSGRTDYVEAVAVKYDPTQISYRDLLAVFFASHDPTTINQQGPDAGAQYASVIFYSDPAQQPAAQQFIRELNASSRLGAAVVTRVESLTEFHPAENYHRDYYARHPGDRYCRLVINPKLEKVQREFANLLKTHGLEK